MSKKYNIIQKDIEIDKLKVEIVELYDALFKEGSQRKRAEKEITRLQAKIDLLEEKHNKDKEALDYFIMDSEGHGE